jgi:S-adenosylmethionine-diacylgycerolhomoserine-N-methlytransferase
VRGVASVAGDARILLHLLKGRAPAADHAASLEAFYAPQAADYDAFRARLLHGREEMIARLGILAGMRVVELGCGTGSSLQIMGPQVATLERFDMVDLCDALLAVARKRAAGQGNIVVQRADATCWQPEQPVDRVFVSYALTMIPDWRQVIANASSMLKPDGRIGVVDFHQPAGGVLNGFWRRWFAHDGVHLNAAHLTTLQQSFADFWSEERRAALPYLPFIRAPYYLFVGGRGIQQQVI